MSALGMYQINFREGIRNTFLRLMPSFAMALILITLVFYVLPTLYIGRGMLGIVLVIAAIGILVARVLIFKTSQSGVLRSRIIFLGSGAIAKECCELALSNSAHHEYEILGFMPVSDEDCQVVNVNFFPRTLA